MSEKARRVVRCEKCGWQIEVEVNRRTGASLTFVPSDCTDADRCEAKALRRAGFDPVA